MAAAGRALCSRAGKRAVSGFSPEWLALREPYDLAARNSAVLDAVVGAYSERPSICLVDLACGTGATLRALAGRLAPRQMWRLVDNDLGLLARAAGMPGAAKISMIARPVDLVCDLELALEAPVDLVTASALLDLVSREWLDRLAMETAARRLPLYAALTYDGRCMLDPGEELDDDILRLFHVHQHSDKGFGPALGPSAAAWAAERFDALGFAVVQGDSDWILGPSDRKIQDALLAGWAQAAQASGAIASSSVSRWLRQRRSHLEAGRSRMRVGHCDIFARPMTAR
jgi:hypothetical protein